MLDVCFANETKQTIRRTLIVCTCVGLPRAGEGRRSGEREVSESEAKNLEFSWKLLKQDTPQFQAAA